jgi:predicted MPP superfamily phosphohydrolase
LIRSLADFAAFVDRNEHRCSRLVSSTVHAEKTLLDSRNIEAAVLLREVVPEQHAPDETSVWPAPDLLHRSDWRRHRARIEQTIDLHTPWGVQRRRRVSVLKATCELVREGLETAGLLSVLVRPSLRVRRTEIDLTFAHLPAAFDGYRILQISDPHFDSLDGIADAIRERVMGLEVDLCVLTGDYRAAETGAFRQSSILDQMADVLAEIEVRDGAVAVLGNHDTHDMVEPLEQVVGVRVLTNEHVEIARDGQRISLLGLDDPYRFYSESTRRFAASLSHDPGQFRIMLVHTPDLADDAARLGCSLYLCGHTHGGQICLPGGKPIVQHLHRERGLGRGLWRRGTMVGYTSLGAGVAGSLPVRLFAPGEVTLFRLRRATA